MNLINYLCILLSLSGVLIAQEKADDVCITEECVETASLLSTSIDKTVSPCDDFYQYSCGNWQKDHPKINNLEGWSHFSKLNHEMQDNLIKLLSNSSIEKEPKYLHPLINFYKGCINIKERDVHGIRDLDIIRNLIKKTGGFPLIDSLWHESSYSIEDAFIELNKIMISKVILSIGTISDLRNNTQPILSIANGFAPQQVIDGIYRIPKEDEEQNLYSFYDTVSPTQLVVEALKGSVINQTLFNEDMKQLQSLDMALRKIATPINNPQYIFSNYDNFKITVKDLDKFTGIKLRKIVDGILKTENVVLNDNDVILADIDYLKNLGSVLNTASNRTIANMVAINLAMILGKFTTSNLTKVISTPDLTILPYHCMSYTEQLLPDLIGRHYMDKMFAKESINEMKEFISSLKEAFHLILADNQWMDKTTKEHSIKKLTAIREHIAFPDYTWNDTELLQYHSHLSNISENSFLTTVLTTFSHQRTLDSKSVKGVVIEKGHWPPRSSGVIINAFYFPEDNGIYFPAGIAQFPFYQHQRTKTVNLGAIGMVISHEMTHAFDNLGSLFDENGNLVNWFTNTSRQTFQEKAQCFVKQYNQYSYDMGNGLFVNISGAHTLGENIADNGGVRIAYKALQLHMEKNKGKLQKLPGTLSTFSEEKLFFLAFANLWCSNKSPASINNQIQRDPHSIENARVIATLSNFPEFAKAFQCPVGSRMNPKERCQLW